MVNADYRRIAPQLRRTLRLSQADSPPCYLSPAIRL
jgi:hypothetical protein